MVRPARARRTPTGPRPEPDSLTVLDDPLRIAALLSPLRRRLLDQLADQPDSATGLSRRLALPRQRLNYHLRELERHGFVELAEERQRRGCVERTLSVTARAYLIDPGLLSQSGADPAAIRDRFSAAYLIAVAGRLVRDVARLRGGAEQAGKTLSTLTLETEVRFASAERRAAFAEELGVTVAELCARYQDASPGSRAYRFVLAVHPSVQSTPDAGHAARDTTEKKTRSRGTPS